MSSKSFSYVVRIFTFLTLLLSGCTEKLENGSLTKDFAGVGDVEVLSPTAVRVYWSAHSRYKEYKVYSATVAEPLTTTAFTEAIIRDLTPNTSYTFKVVATNGTTTVGGGREVTVTTLPPFQGATNSIKDADGNIIVAWSYPHKVTDYRLYYKKYEDPTAANTTNWVNPDATSTEDKYIFRNLEKSTRYHFIVHAKYLDGTFGISEKVVTATTNSSFPTPIYELSPISIGSLPFAKVDPVVNATFQESNYVSRMYLNENPISDPLVGKGILSFSSNLNFPLGKLNDLTLKVSYNNGSTNETQVFDKLSTYIKGLSPTKELPPVANLSSGLSYMGESLTTGDFNCDGAPDLAVGLPKASLASLGVKNAKAGAVYVYYSFKDVDDRYKLKKTPAPSLNPLVPGVDPQIITFEDLTDQSQFGKSLSGSGNLNGDTFLGKACQDLLVGAPGLNTDDPGSYDGAAFVIFGSSQGLKAPNRIRDMQQNTTTCNGLSDGATCSAVMLWPNMKLYPTSLYNPNVTPKPDVREEFGFAVSFIGDFNADGFDDLAVGSPGAPWDGLANALQSGDTRYEYGVGYVALYFGSKFGLGTENIKNSDLRFIKIFPPYPHAYQRFGASVAGGVDIDGAYRTRINASSPFYGGPDLVIGAPGFNYPFWNGANKFYSAPTVNCWLGGMKDPDQCKVASGFHSNEDGGWGSYNLGTNAYGFTQNGSTSLNGSVGISVGAAFVYFGVGSTTNNTIVSNVSDRNVSFYRCGFRGGTNIAPIDGRDHFSCFAGAQGATFGGKMPYRILFPRSDYKNLKNVAFGSSVGVAGNPSRYDATNTEITTKVDPNADGFGEVIVSSGLFSDNTTGTSNSGAFWTFYGNSFRLFEQKAFFGLDNGGITRSDSDWRDISAACSAFNSDSDAVKMACAPTLTRSISVSAGTMLGFAPESMAVADITGDGIKDVVLGGFGDSTKGTNAGAVLAFTSLSGVGVTSNFFKYYNSNGKPYDYFGRSVAVGDFDGDVVNGKIYNDIAAGAYLDKSTKLGGGAVYGFLSNGQPLSSMITIPNFNLQDSIASLQNFGLGSTRIIGDVNGDGFEDAVARISRPSSTSEFYVTDAVIYFGSSIGLVTTSFCKENRARIFKDGSGSDSLCYPSSTPAQGITKSDIPLPQLIARPSALSEGWAKQAFAAGDINGDGFADVAFQDYSTGGQIVVYYGTRGGLQAINNPSWTPASGDPQIITKANAPSIGSGYDDVLNDLEPDDRENITFGDFNGDFKTDLVISNPLAPAFFSMNKTGSGTVGVLPKNGSDPISSNEGWQCGTFAPGVQPPATCTSGTPAYEMGRVFIYYGSANGVQTPKVRGYSAGEEPSVNFGNTASHSTYLVDIYGSDSTSTLEACNSGTKVCKTQYLYSPMVENVMFGYEIMRHRFGTSVVAFDQNGDGIDDLAIGAPGWEDIGCYYDPAAPTDPAEAHTRMNYGKVFLFRGSNKGLVGKARNTYYNDAYDANNCLSNDLGRTDDPSLNISGTIPFAQSIFPPLPGTTLPSYNGPNRGFGHRLQSADLNKDGYKDLIVSAPIETPLGGLNAQGVLYVYYGPLCGADNAPEVWNFYHGNVGNYNKQKYYTDAGINIAATADCGNKKLAPQAFIIKDALASDYSGTTLASGRRRIYKNDPTEQTRSYADFNGDGIDDIIIGSSGWDDTVNSNVNHGRGVVYFGSTYGLFTDDFPNTSVVVGDISDSAGKAHTTVKPYVIPFIDSEQSPMFFRTHTSAGDVNGDGTMDLMGTSKYHDGYAPLRGIDIGTYFLFY